MPDKPTEARIDELEEKLRLLALENDHLAERARKPCCWD